MALIFPNIRGNCKTIFSSLSLFQLRNIGRESMATDCLVFCLSTQDIPSAGYVFKHFMRHFLLFASVGKTFVQSHDLVMPMITMEGPH